MPELPEMERYRMELSHFILHQPITEVEITREKTINVLPDKFLKQLVGSSIIRIDRRAKYLIFTLNTGQHLLLHLMLGGWMYLGNRMDSPERTKQVTLSFGEKQLFFIGLRLGFLHLLETNELEERLKDLGPEPLDPSFTLEVFQSRITKKRGTLKSLLVDQKFIAGIGNCYSDEICYEARLHPASKASELNQEQIERLFLAIKPVLNRALEIGGYMDDPLYKGDQKTGQYNDHFLVYETEGLPCKRCATPIERIQVSSRKSFICPTCQA